MKPRQAPPEPSFREGRARRERIGALYEIGKILNPYADTLRETIPAILTVLTEDLPLRCTIVIEKTADVPKILVWQSSNILPAELMSAEARALKSYAFFSRSHGHPLERLEAPLTERASTAGEGAAPGPMERGRFLDCPLVVRGGRIFGSIHVEGAAAFDESDAEFVSSIANQLAIALDRNQSRRDEIALRERAEELNKFKTSLVAVVSHEFGNALSVMKMAAGLLQKKLPRKWLKESDRLFEMILVNIAGLTSAVQNLLNMSRLEAGKLAIDVRATNAAAIMTSSLESMALLCEKKSLSAGTDFPDDLRLVRADEATLALVVSNLLSNAIKYTPEGGRIVLGILRESTRPDHYRLYVQDSGIGISAEDRARILAGHYRTEDGRKMTAKGFGVGLSLAQQIVEAHGSTIEIEGSPGQGSRFSFLLPIDGTRA
ncbi:MAG: ATP-binding protein [Elusimicrobiota bacterium]